MAATAKPHLVILVHGIRDIARWQNEVRQALEAEGFIVEPTSYGRWNLILFLLPFDFIRRIAIGIVWKYIQQARMLHPGADVSVVAHSFGTFVVTRILKEQFTLQLKRLILCGSVVRYSFEFEQIQDRFTPPLINDVGTADPWPALAESLTTGYGSAGTFGFNRPAVRDRYHNGSGHGHFLKGDFAKQYWAPFLRDGTIVPGDVAADNPPLWVRLIHVVKIKWLIVLALILGGIWLGLAVAYRQSPMSLQFGDSGFGFWSGTVAASIELAAAPCPLPSVLCGSKLTRAISGRRYVAVDIVGGDPRDVVSCGRFRFPNGADVPSADPVDVLQAVARAFPQCLAVSATDTWLGVTLDSNAMVPVKSRFGDTLLCGCDDAEVARFTQAYGRSN